ncbi:uncharacterized protein LOC135341606 isoform X2 [Halichondria panicea]|uniref:uncharacterized protein LOC135341606 isoform X2 n=1 Tax=Halichondria panicea TaxID=6063 RepID=UPI00312B9E39
MRCHSVPWVRCQVFTLVSIIIAACNGTCMIVMEEVAGPDKDPLLADFFNEYLSLEVFGIKLTYRRGCLQEVGGALLPGKQDQDKLLNWNWCTEHRWKFFLKSRLYTEFKLCSFLFTRQASVLKESSTWPLEPALSPWGPSRQQSNSLPVKETTMDNRYEDYKRLRGFLVGTHGDTLIQVWLNLEAWQVGVVNEWWSALCAIREQCSAVPGLVKYSCGGPMETGAWVEAVKIECEDRLGNYWLPRFKHRGQRFQIRDSSLMSYDMSCDPNEPFKRGLRCNQNAGRPFESFLQSSDLEHCIHWVKLWEALDWILLIQQSRSDQYVVREGWRLWSLFIDGQFDCGNSLMDTYITRDNKDSLLKSLTESSRCSVVKDLTLIQDVLLSSLKRVWTQFLRLDHHSFTQYINVSAVSTIGSPKQQASSNKSQNSRRQKKAKDSEKFMLDVKGTPFESLEDFDQTLLCFEQYLFSKCGPNSQSSFNYHMWKMLRKLTLTKEPKKRDALAVRIYQKFLYLGAKQFLHLPDYLLKQIDQTAVMCRPTSPTLKALTEFSSLYLQTTVNTFLSKGLDSGTDEVSDSLFPPLHNSKRVRRCKTTSAMQQRNETQHLLFTLTRCVGPISLQLHAFGKFLDRQCLPGQHGKLLNNVRFWHEVQKFNAMFVDETSNTVLFHKGEAIVDRYLDTASQPWIKVTVPGELAAQVVSALGDLHRVKARAHSERLQQLLEKTQEIVFADIAPYWGTFCAQYTSPDGSTISIPCAGELSTLPSRRRTLQLPPITHQSIHTPLLSFSSLKGLKWRTAF